MITNLSQLPWGFWLAALILYGLVFEGIANWNRAWGKPALAVYGTVGVWYLGDILYNSLASFAGQFSDHVISIAFLQVAGFLVAYRGLLVWLTPKLARVSRGAKHAKASPAVAANSFIWTILTVWLVLFCVGLWIAEWQIGAILWPPAVSEKVGLFVHPGVGGATDFLIASAGYVYLLVCSLFGVLFVLGPRLFRWAMLILMICTWPYFLFDRIRNTMLALILPGIVAYLLLKRDFWLRKTIVGLGLFVAVNFWFSRVMDYRQDYDVSAFLTNKTEAGQKVHFGLNMFEELCWINTFIENGEYKINFGRSYLEQLANVVPRAIWANKPMIGVDYAVARGFGGAEGGAGVFASVSMGMIGNGLVNFGRVFGVLSSALLMALWTAFLARLWEQRNNLPRACLFLVGLGLTFNLGRDITLLVLWPFVFGYLGIRAWEYVALRPQRRTPASRRLSRARRSTSSGDSNGAAEIASPRVLD